MKKSLVVILVISFIFIGFTNSQLKAQGIFGNSIISEGASSYLSMLMLADWQVDYLMPIEPDELKKGDYRIYGNAANFSMSNLNNSLILSTDKTNVSVMNYLFGFDTALRDDLYFHINYNISPWQAASDASKDKTKYQLLNMFLDYEIDNDKKIYFGYNKNNYSMKQYDETAQEYNLTADNDVNIIYVGFEMKGSFLK